MALRTPRGGHYCQQCPLSGPQGLSEGPQEPWGVGGMKEPLASYPHPSQSCPSLQACTQDFVYKAQIEFLALQGPCFKAAASIGNEWDLEQ